MKLILTLVTFVAQPVYNGRVTERNNTVYAQIGRGERERALVNL